MKLEEYLENICNPGDENSEFEVSDNYLILVKGDYPKLAERLSNSETFNFEREFTEEGRDTMILHYDQGNVALQVSDFVPKSMIRIFRRDDIQTPEVNEARRRMSEYNASIMMHPTPMQQGRSISDYSSALRIITDIYLNEGYDICLPAIKSCELGDCSGIIYSE